MTEPLVFAFHDDHLYTFERGDRHSFSTFGGPMLAVTGAPFGPKPLHVIATLNVRHLPLLTDHGLHTLPLIYGLNYESCELEYRLKFGHLIEVLRIAPSASLDDWPYANFPPLLPFVPLRLADPPERISYDGFASRFPNMPDRPGADLVVAVPPPATIGVSVWGDGDGEGVTMVFECDLVDRTVYATHVTS